MRGQKSRRSIKGWGTDGYCSRGGTGGCGEVGGSGNGMQRGGEEGLPEKERGGRLEDGRMEDGRKKKVWQEVKRREGQQKV